MSIINHISRALGIVPTADHLPDIFEKPKPKPSATSPDLLRAIATAPDGTLVLEKARKTSVDGMTWDILNVGKKAPASAKGGLVNYSEQLTRADIEELQAKKINLETGAALKLIFARNPNFTARELATAGKVSETTAQNAKRAFKNALSKQR